MSAITKAIGILGGPLRMASMFRVSPQAVYFWKSGKRRVPAEVCPSIERATDGAVRCEDLRPDVEWSVLRTPGDTVAA